MSTKKTASSRRSRKHVVLCIEGLERRTCRAGDVAVEIDDGFLKVTGDAFGNEVLVQQVDVQKFRVTGLNGTTVNGLGQQEFVFNGQDVEIGLKDGDDRLVMNDFNGRRIDIERLAIDTGKGRDVVDLDDLTVRGDERVDVYLGSGNQNETDVLTLDDADIHPALRVVSGGGDDTVDIEESMFGDDLTIESGTGDDHVTLGRVAEGLSVAGKIKADLGKGDDSLHVSEVSAATAEVVLGDGVGDLTVEGINVAGQLKIHGGSIFTDIEMTEITADELVISVPKGRTTADVADVDVHKLAITTGGGVDRVGLVRVSANEVFAKLGKGDDSFLATDLGSQKSTIEAGRGNDEVTLRASFGMFLSNEVKILGDKGDDRVTINHGRFATLTVDGGAGDDTLEEESVVVFINEEVKNVETRA